MQQTVINKLKAISMYLTNEATISDLASEYDKLISNNKKWAKRIKTSLLKARIQLNYIHERVEI
jgi:transposase-like protein